MVNKIPLQNKTERKIVNIFILQIEFLKLSQNNNMNSFEQIRITLFYLK